MSKRTVMKSECTIATVLCLLLVTTGYGRSDQSQPLPRHDGKRSYEEFRSAVKSFPYTASPERKERILAGYPKLEVGMTKEQVAVLIGEPDYSQLSYGPKGPNMRWKGSSWSYYLYKRGDGVNSFDPVVQVFFGTNDRAKWIVPSNIEGLREKGSPSEDRT